MKNIILCVFVTLINLSAFKGQNFRVHYQMTYKADSSKDETTKKHMILDVSDDLARFYSYNLYRIDSMGINNSTIRKKAADYDFMIFKNKKESNTEKFYVIGLDRYSLKEDKSKFDWKITEEVKNVSGINCQKALLNYKGRKWEAWFAKDIPFQEGPYIFDSLPGLIVEMKDSRNDYLFVMTQLEKDVKAINAKQEAISVSRKQLEKILTDYYNDPFKELKSGKATIKVVDESGRKVTPNFKQLTEAKQKNIRENNNPIELTDAMQYR